MRFFGAVQRCMQRYLFAQSLLKWGLHSQLLMLVEELNELAVAVLHLERKIKNETLQERTANLEQFAIEIADVELLVDEVKCHFNIQHKVAYYRRKKLHRLAGLLEIEL